MNRGGGSFFLSPTSFIRSFDGAMMPIKTLSSRIPGLRPIATGALLAAFALPGVSVTSFAAEEGPPAPAKKSAAAVPRAISKNPNQVKGDEITPAQKQAVDKGLAWLSK